MTLATTPRWPRRIGTAVLASLALVLGGVATTSATQAAAEGAIRDVGTSNVVPDSYVVVFKHATTGAQDVDRTANDLAAHYGGTVGHTYHNALRGFEISVGEVAARRLAADPAVDYVQRNGIYTIAGTQLNPPSWGLDRIDQRTLPLDNSYTYPNTAPNVHAYIIDTGIRRTHVDFGGRATTGIDEVTPGGTADDCNGHGTHVSGTVGGASYGMAKAVALVAVRVLDCSGSGTTAGVAAGVDWVTTNAIKPAVANMSLGGSPDPVLESSVSRSIASGVSYAIAAGNSSGDACAHSPARVATAITVAATDITDTRASFSNYGTCVHIFAPGVNITSAWNTNDTATNSISGTSMATPHVAGAAAMILSTNPTYTAQQVKDAMLANATPNVVIDPGPSSPNLLLYVGSTAPPPPPANDFSIAVSPTSGTVAAGAAATATVSTTLTRGAAQTVTLSTSGLPAGATASFNPASVTSGGTSTLTITTATTTLGGTYPITITGTGTGVSHTTTYTLTVTGGCGDTCQG